MTSLCQRVANWRRAKRLLVRYGASMRALHELDSQFDEDPCSFDGVLVSQHRYHAREVVEICEKLRRLGYRVSMKRPWRLLRI